MSIVAASTKLESVNIMLSAIGESPINTLSETTGLNFDNTVLPIDAQMAVSYTHLTLPTKCWLYVWGVGV